jgi:hypothetical protein
MNIPSVTVKQHQAQATLTTSKVKNLHSISKENFKHTEQTFKNVRLKTYV